MTIKSSGSDSDELSQFSEPMAQLLKPCPGLNTLNKCKDKVREVIGDHLEDIVTPLRKCGIISVPLYSELTTSIADKEQKADILYWNLLLKVEHDESNYSHFRDILCKNSKFKPTVVMLDEAYGRSHGKSVNNLK